MGMLDSRGKPKAEKEKLIVSVKKSKQDEERMGNSSETEGRMGLREERVGGKRKRGRGDWGYWNMETGGGGLIRGRTTRMERGQKDGDGGMETEMGWRDFE